MSLSVKQKGVAKLFWKTRLTNEKSFFYIAGFVLGQIAQLVEQRTENPCVPSSILGLATTFYLDTGPHGS